MAGILKIGGATEPTGAREDLSDLIRTADVAETPFFAMAKKSAGPKNVLFQFQPKSYQNYRCEFLETPPSPPNPLISEQNGGRIAMLIQAGCADEKQ